MSDSEYSRRMNRVLDFIDQHLDQPLDLDLLAKVAHFSSYHFHRVFSAWAGETLSDYIQRRRLARAAYQLVTRADAAILDIAIAAGFSSGEAFARAFKRKFGHTPTAWRVNTPQRWKEQVEQAQARIRLQQRNPDHYNSNFDQVSASESGDHDNSEQPKEWSGMMVKLRELPVKRVAYIRKIGPYGASIPQFWQEVVNPWLLANGLENEPRYGIPYDDKDITPPEKCRYDACVEVPVDFVAKGNAMLATLPGGKYAVAQFRDMPPMVADAWTELFHDWLPQSGLQCDARPFFAHFPRNTHVDVETGIVECELCIPVRPL